jgi:tRNA (cmo5U34)-methyltransferase
MQRRDHHDWTSETYVEEWVRRQQAEDRARAERFQLLCDLLPFPSDAAATILDVGTGYGPVSKFILDRYPQATCIGQDGSEPMLRRARQLMASYGRRFVAHRSDLFDADWLPKAFAPFDAVVSSGCLHNLRDFPRICQIYADIRAHLKPGGVFLNLDLVNAPTPALQERYAAVVAARRRRQGADDHGVAALVRSAERPAVPSVDPFPAGLDQHLAALKAAGFRDVDCFWKDLQRALYGGYVA